MNEPIIFREQNVAGEKVVYAVTDWPEQTSIAPELLTISPFISENEHGDIIITVANGTAVYRRAVVQPSERYLAVYLVNSSWSQTPLLERTR